MKCFNWKVIAALAAIGIGMYALAPGTALAAGPLLILAVCPVSMVLMIRAMGSMGSCPTKDDSETNPVEVAELRAEIAELRRQQAEACAPYAEAEVAAVETGDEEVEVVHGLG